MEKIKKLKKIFDKNKIDGYLVPKNDEYFSEYIPNYNDRLSFISNFDGSYGLSLILKKENYLFVDGRYTLQAKNQSGKFFKVITFPNKMPYKVLGKKKLIIAFDPKLFTKKNLNLFFGKTKCKFIPLKKNLVDEIWKRNIGKSKEKFYLLPNKSVGNNYKSKINKVASQLQNYS